MRKNLTGFGLRLMVIMLYHLYIVTYVTQLIGLMLYLPIMIMRGVTFTDWNRICLEMGRIMIIEIRNIEKKY